MSSTNNLPSSLPTTWDQTAQTEFERNLKNKYPLENVVAQVVRNLHAKTEPILVEMALKNLLMTMPGRRDHYYRTAKYLIEQIITQLFAGQGIYQGYQPPIELKTKYINIFVQIFMELSLQAIQTCNPLGFEDLTAKGANLGVFRVSGDLQARPDINADINNRNLRENNDLNHGFGNDVRGAGLFNANNNLF